MTDTKAEDELFEVIIRRCNEENQKPDYDIAEFPRDEPPKVRSDSDSEPSSEEDPGSPCIINGRQYFDWVGVRDGKGLMVGFDFSTKAQRASAMEKFDKIVHEQFSQKILTMPLRRFFRLKELDEFRVEFMMLVLPMIKTVTDKDTAMVSMSAVESYVIVPKRGTVEELQIGLGLCWDAGQIHAEKDSLDAYQDNNDMNKKRAMENPNIRPGAKKYLEHRLGEPSKADITEDLKERKFARQVTRSHWQTSDDQAEGS